MSTGSTIALSKPRQSIFQWNGAHWFATFLIAYGLWVWTPFLAPVFMRLGWDGAGRAVYFVYSFFCHQLPERSFFFFGAQPMYSLAEIQAAWQDTINPIVLRQFIGNETMGWKVAWSDRMISFYTSVWIFAVAWYPFRRKVKPLTWWGFVLLLLPIVMDGGTHLVSDFAGIGNGFRDTNTWLAALTNYTLPTTFYAGDAFGSFNSLMRLVSGLLAGLAIAWLTFPYIFQTQNYNQLLDNIRYAVLETIKSQNSHPAGG